jgi:dCMP deaminase
MSEESSDTAMAIFTNDGERIGITWASITNHGLRYSWTATDKRKSTMFFITRDEAIATLRKYHAQFVVPFRKVVITRPSMDQTLMQMAKLMADRATCSRAQVGAVIVIETRPVSSGYNGTAAGLPHCNHACDCTKLPTNPDPKHHWVECASRQPCKFSVHAEANAIAFAAKNGVATEGATLYTTMAPCLECAKLIMNAGIVRVVAAEQYRDDSGTRLLLSLGVDVHAELL